MPDSWKTTLATKLPSSNVSNISEIISGELLREESSPLLSAFQSNVEIVQKEKRKYNLNFFITFIRFWNIFLIFEDLKIQPNLSQIDDLHLEKR
jgi:hypothetical protein